MVAEPFEIYPLRGTELAESVVAITATRAIAPALATVPRETMAVIDEECRRIDVPGIVGAWIVAGESEFDLFATGDGGLSHGGLQAHIPAHNHGRDHWIGLQGLRNTFQTMGGRWRQAFTTLDWPASFPVDWLTEFWPRAQGCQPVFAAREAPRAHRSGTAAWQAYVSGGDGGGGVVIRELWHDAETGWDLPATPPVTGRWNPPSHYGVDIGGGGKRSLVLSVTDGVVVYAGWFNVNGQPANDHTGYGLIAVVRSDGRLHLYGHNDEIAVSIGDTVKRGQQIAWMGNTGHVEPFPGQDGSHVHYGVFTGQGIADVNNANAIDPTPWLALGKVRWRGRTNTATNIRRLPAFRDADGNDTRVYTAAAGTPFFVPEDTFVPITIDGRALYASSELLDLDGTGGPVTPPAPVGREVEYRESAIRAWRHVRDGAAFVIESGSMGAAMAQDTINAAVVELQKLGADV